MLQFLKYATASLKAVHCYILLTDINYPMSNLQALLHLHIDLQYSNLYSLLLCFTNNSGSRPSMKNIYSSRLRFARIIHLGHLD